MSESLRNDGRVWVPKKAEDVGKASKDPASIPDEDRDYYLERKYPSYGNLSPRDIASRAAKEACDDGRGVGPGGRGVYLDFRDAIKRDSQPKIAEKYGNLFDMYARITGENPYKQCRCASTPPSTTRWAGCGSTTTCSRRSPACSCSARPTSPTTAPTASAPRR
jgi:succinate dehydrogenase/fumarate reductase flavoprotein subunit